MSINDKNDNYPKFETVSYVGSIKENSPNGTSVFIVSTIYTTFYNTSIIPATEKKLTSRSTFSYHFLIKESAD